MVDSDLFRQQAQAIVEVSHVLYQQGWSPATSSNYSARLDDSHCAIIASGKHKGKLTVDDVMVVDLNGNPIEDKKPSAETLLHTQLYQFDKDIGAVLHTHSVPVTTLTMHFANDRELVLANYELLKAFKTYPTHDDQLSIPIFDNTQDMIKLASQVDQWIHGADRPQAYLIRGHGLYTWGETMDECYRHLEALECLMQSELNRLLLRNN